MRLNLVTGACGFAGSHLVKLLLDKGEKVVATDLPPAFHSQRNRRIFRNIDLDLSHPNVEVVPSDLTRPETLKPLFGSVSCVRRTRRNTTLSWSMNHSSSSRMACCSVANAGLALPSARKNPQ